MQALVAAASVGDVEGVRTCLEQGISPDQGQPPPVWAACAGGHVAVVRELLDLGADPNISGRRHGNAAGQGEPMMYALHVAAARGHTECLQALVAAGANVEQRQPADGATVLHVASTCVLRCVVHTVCERRGQECVSRLSRAVDGGGATAVWRAAAAGDVERLQCLLATLEPADVRVAAMIRVRDNACVAGGTCCSVGDAQCWNAWQVAAVRGKLRAMACLLDVDAPPSQASAGDKSDPVPLLPVTRVDLGQVVRWSLRHGESDAACHLLEQLVQLYGFDVWSMPHDDGDDSTETGGGGGGVGEEGKHGTGEDSTGAVALGLECITAAADPKTWSTRLVNRVTRLGHAALLWRLLQCAPAPCPDEEHAEAALKLAASSEHHFSLLRYLLDAYAASDRWADDAAAAAQLAMEAGSEETASGSHDNAWIALLTRLLCVAGSVEVMRELYGRGAGLTSWDGGSALCNGARRGNASIVRDALSLGCAVPEAASASAVALLQAVGLGGSPDVAHVLLHRGLSQGWSHALGAAARLGHMDLVTTLLERGVPPDGPRARDHQVGTLPYATPLLEAVVAGHDDVVSLLLLHGADANARQPQHAAWPNVVVAALLHRSSDESVLATVLQAHGWSDAMVPLAWPDAQLAGRTPLLLVTHAACSDQQRQRLAHTLLTRGNANVDAEVPEGPWAGFTPLMYAAQRGDGACVTCFLAHGASPRLRTGAGTAFSLAMRAGHPSLAQAVRTHVSGRMGSTSDCSCGMDGVDLRGTAESGSEGDNGEGEGDATQEEASAGAPSDDAHDGSRSMLSVPVADALFTARRHLAAFAERCDASALETHDVVHLPVACQASHVDDEPNAQGSESGAVCASATLLGLCATVSLTVLLETLDVLPVSREAVLGLVAYAYCEDCSWLSRLGDVGLLVHATVLAGRLRARRLAVLGRRRLRASVSTPVHVVSALSALDRLPVPTVRECGPDVREWLIGLGVHHYGAIFANPDLRTKVRSLNLLEELVGAHAERTRMGGDAVALEESPLQPVVSLDPLWWPFGACTQMPGGVSTNKDDSLRSMDRLQGGLLQLWRKRSTSADVALCVRLTQVTSALEDDVVVAVVAHSAVLRARCPFLCEGVTHVVHMAPGAGPVQEHATAVGSDGVRTRVSHQWTLGADVCSLKDVMQVRALVRYLYTMDACDLEPGWVLQRSLAWDLDACCEPLIAACRVARGTTKLDAHNCVPAFLTALESNDEPLQAEAMSAMQHHAAHILPSVVQLLAEQASRLSALEATVAKLMATLGDEEARG